MRPTGMVLFCLTLVLCAYALRGPAQNRPAYTAGYNALEDIQKQALVEIQGLRQDVRAVGLGRAPATDLATVVKKSCASCHAAAVSAESGGDFTLLEKDGSLTRLTPNEIRKLKRKVKNRSMPPAPAELPESERQLIATLKEDGK